MNVINLTSVNIDPCDIVGLENLLKADFNEIVKAIVFHQILVAFKNF